MARAPLTGSRKLLKKAKMQTDIKEKATALQWLFAFMY
jgi:hypothetical protein